MGNALARVSRISVSPRRGTSGARAILFKADRPRAVDRYIDYFGSSRAERAPTSLANTLLDELLARTPA
jgi:hypothetical protein